MEIQAFATLVIPFIIVVYLAALLFIHPTRASLLASLLGGLTMGVINILFDLIAYYAHWWHYTLNGLIFALAVAILYHANIDLRQHCVPAHLALLAGARPLVRPALIVRYPSFQSRHRRYRRGRDTVKLYQF